ncbi:thiol-activated cytolysin family protein [Echinicola sp. CAU 1574]|uniref:Thiol-activated cytolysin family protein n=1 Tax=Echinicola arenosa TaxID=2774144 RepID=A0ABR9AFR9_9BACT|nr:thiol-activated cytolysin family protein [Echinicola arenosa]MBD8487299.1 thiol-activated cytolysin family protein [Echinicola arenosa]
MLKRTLLFALILVGLYSCQQEEEVNPKTNSTDSFDNSKNPFRSMPTILQAKEGIAVKKKKGLDGENANLNCLTEMVIKTVSPEKLTMVDEPYTKIYPGSIFTAESVLNGDYTPIINVNKLPQSIIFNVNGLQNDPTRTIIPTKSNYADIFLEIENSGVIGGQPAILDHSVEQVYSEEHMNIAIGANMNVWKLQDLQSDFDFSSSNKNNIFVAKFLQEFFTVEMDYPEDGVYVEEYPDSEIFGEYSPMYISGLSYGRLAIFCLESSHSVDSINYALNTTMSFIAGEVGVEVSSEFQRIINTSKMKVVIRGGSGNGAVQSVNGYEEFKSFLRDGGEYNENNRGAVIGYGLRQLSDHDDVSVSLNAEYEVQECKVEIFSYWSDNAKDHFYSTSYSPTAGGGNWTVEGRVFYGVPAETEGARPVYQYWNSSGKDHLYTFDNQASIGAWQREYIAFYAFDHQVEGTQPVYSYYNSDAADHYYNFDVGVTAGGGGKWKREYVAFYAYP